MSSAATPASSGFKLGGADRKKVIWLVVCVALAGFLWWRNSQDSDTPSSSATTSAFAGSRNGQQASLIAEPGAGAANARLNRRGERNSDRNALVMRPVDASQGTIDPTLRLELLERLNNVKPAGAGRSLFEAGTAPVVVPTPGKPGSGPIIQVGKTGKPQPLVPPPTTPVNVVQPPAPIPLKFYGFIRPVTAGETKRGFFLDGDVIVVASEGEVIKPHYRVIKLQDHSAVLEDTSNKNQQTLPLVPESRNDL